MCNFEIIKAFIQACIEPAVFCGDKNNYINMQPKRFA